MDLIIKDCDPNVMKLIRLIHRVLLNIDCI